MAGSRWYYVLNEHRFGPIPSPELRKLARKRILKPQDLVWKKSLPDWIPAAKVKGLFPKSKQKPKRKTVPHDGDDSYDRFLKGLNAGVQHQRLIPSVESPPDSDVDSDLFDQFEQSARDFDSAETPLKVQLPAPVPRPNTRDGKRRSKNSSSSSDDSVHIPRPNLYPAGFWIRLFAYIIDAVICAILSAPTVLAAFILSQKFAPGFLPPELPKEGVTLSMIIVIMGPVLLVLGAYFILLEASSWQGTIGKALLGLRVVASDGHPISFGAAVLRNLVKFGPWYLVAFLFSGIPGGAIVQLIVFCTWIMAAFTPLKQALHDYAANTVVTRL